MWLFMLMQWPLHMTILQGKCSDILRQGEAQFHIFSGGNKVLGVVCWIVTVSDIGWIGKEQLVNEWLEKWVHNKNCRRQPKYLWIKLHAHCTNNKDDMQKKKKKWKMNGPLLHYYWPAGETIHKKHYYIIMQHFKFCFAVESANTYCNIHLHMHFYLKRRSFIHILQTRCGKPL